MAAPTKLNFKMYQGSTFNEVLRRESQIIKYAPITAVANSAPVTITSTAHNIPDGWRAKITGIVGMKELNNSDTYHILTLLNTNAVSINSVNSLAYTPYVSGGVLEYYEPKSLSNVFARMQLREKIDSVDILDEYTSANGKIVLNDVNKTITLNVPAEITEGYSFKQAVYSLELVDNSIVVPFLVGTITLVREVTR